MNLKPLKITLSTLLFLFLFISNNKAQNNKHIEVSLRMIGHQVLLNSNDSTSRVLPIVKNKNQYMIEFEYEFEFIPEELVATINKVVKETQIAPSYILEVEECKSKKVVYSYEIGDLDKSNIIPCQSRAIPKACYRLLFTLTGIESIDSPTLQAKEETTASKNIFILSFLLLIAVGLFILWKKKNSPPINPNLIPLGNYLFDKKDTVLLIDNQKIDLTTKEASLLLLLHNTVNETIKREVILNMVWGDEGDYIGRTLDVFISKLRKKLAINPSVKIVTVRGVGYKLVIDT